MRTIENANEWLSFTSAIINIVKRGADGNLYSAMFPIGYKGISLNFEEPIKGDLTEVEIWKDFIHISNNMNKANEMIDDFIKNDTVKVEDRDVHLLDTCVFEMIQEFSATHKDVYRVSGTIKDIREDKDMFDIRAEMTSITVKADECMVDICSRTMYEYDYVNCEFKRVKQED